MNNDTDNKVVGLRGAHPAGQPARDEQVVADLRELLSSAEQGQIHGLAYTCVRPNGLETGWAGKADRHMMVSGVALLQYRIIKANESS